MENKLKPFIEDAKMFNKFCDNVMAVPQQKLSKGFLEAKNQMIATMWAKLDNTFSQIREGFTAEYEVTVSPEVSKLFADSTKDYQQAFITFDEVMVHVHTAMEQFDKQEVPQLQPLQLPENIVLHTNNPSNIKLKPIDIPTFDGDYKRWISFRSMFDSLIHDREINPLQKLHYLKSCLSDEAKRFIAQFDVTEEAYKPAYDALVERFHNEVILVDIHIISILSQPELTRESSDGLKELLDVTTENLRALKTLNIDTETWDPFLLLLLVQKLDASSRRLWEQTLKPKVRPTMKEFLDFLSTRFHALGCQQKFSFSMEPATNTLRYRNKSSFKFSKTQSESSSFPPRTHQNFHGSAKPQQECPFRCIEPHDMMKCERFLRADARTRQDLVTCAKLCKNCLKPHNGRCSMQPGCATCRKYHHTSLHFETVEPSPNASTMSNRDRAGAPVMEPSVQTHHVHLKQPITENQPKVAVEESGVIRWDESVLLSTAIVLVRSVRDDRFYPFRALLDDASEVSYVSEYLAQTMGLVKQSVFANSTGLGGVTTGKIKHVVEFEIGSKQNTSFHMRVQGPITTKVTNPLPSSYVKISDWKHLEGLSLADPRFNVPSKIDLLLGAPVYGYLMLPGLIKASPSEPVAKNTEFGWILSGPVREMPITRTVATFHLKISVDDQLKKFFEQEELSKERILTQEEVACEKFYMDTYKRNEDGRFVVALPFKVNPEQLGSSKGQAISRLTSLEGRFRKSKKLKEEYTAILQEYEDLQHTSHLGELSNDGDTSQNYYLPHHAVFKPESTTTKTRVVFDASAKGTKGVSLNDLLMTGPTLQEELITILIRWRSHQFIFTTDVTKMYRQIEVRVEDRKYQKFLYRKGEEEKIQEYQHNRVTFGVTSATYLAVKSLQQLATEEQDDFPQAAEIVRRDFYMDDGMSGSDTEEMCIKLCKDLKTLLLRGKLELKKFVSNSARVLESIPEEDREIKLPMEINLDNTVKTLGIHYHPTTDEFQFKVNLKASDEWPTKRSLLSETSKLFDPLGWLAPVVIKAKILFQRLWQEGLTWDQQLPESIATTWMEFRNSLHSLERIRIPRWIGKGLQTKIFELHGFSDASELAYSAVIYARVVNMDGSVYVMMVTSKTRVAPIKPVTLPRLELCGLVLLANLMAVVRKALDVSKENVHAWTDSTIVLGWLRANPSKFKTYVANRIVEVHEFLNVNQCHHIEGTNNPADCASRGINPSELEGHELWWNGPECLRENRSSWDQQLIIPEPTLELKTKFLSTFVITATDELQELLKRYSSFKKLIRMTAICMKFIDNSKKLKESRIISFCLTFINKLRAKTQKSPLMVTTEDLRNAELRIIRLCQSKEFPDEIHHLANKEAINAKSKILPLNPFLDTNGCLRMGGRLNEAGLAYERKHPLILSQGTISKLIVRDSHEKAMHGGVKLTMNLVRESFWIINLRRQVKKYILDCVKCCRFKKENSEQIMADLPWARVNISAPFTHVGLDYAGPYKLKASNIRSTPIRIKPIVINGEVIKSMPKVPVYEGYIAIFVCVATKAIHMEVVSDKSTDAFLCAFDRFTARKGFPECCYSDNAATFIGAKCILALDPENSLLEFDRVSRHAVENGTDWKFIPPRAPHHGGIWEIGVKSMKHHLKRVVGDNTLTYEEMSTVLAKIEACLNSRPLCPLNDDPDDLAALTPGHFLIGRPLVVRPEGKSISKTIGARDRWRMVQRIQGDFWKAWSNEYLNELQNRQKWMIQKRNFKEGDMVLSKEDNVAPSKWPLARIIKVHPSRDENVRSVTIRMIGENGRLTELVRPIVKLRLIPTNAEEDDNLIELGSETTITN